MADQFWIGLCPKTFKNHSFKFWTPPPIGGLIIHASPRKGKLACWDFFLMKRTLNRPYKLLVQTPGLEFSFCYLNQVTYVYQLVKLNHPKHYGVLRYSAPLKWIKPIWKTLLNSYLLTQKVLKLTIISDLFMSIYLKSNITSLQGQNLKRQKRLICILKILCP